MKIIILGAGQVGGSLAEHLAGEKNEITLVDINAERLHELQDRLDIGTVTGHASHPDVLRRAGAEDADMMIAVTNSDEINMIACQIAFTLFHTPTKVSRIRSPQYQNREDIFRNEAIPIDVWISPEKLVTTYLQHLVEHPNALQVLDFASGRIQLVAVKAYYGGPMIGQELREIRKHMPKGDTRVAAIFRRDRPIIPEGSTIVEVDDEVFFIAAREYIPSVMAELRRMESPYKRIIIAGGGNIGARLAKTIEHDYRIKVIEFNKQRARYLSERLEKAIVLHGSASDRDLLQAENIENTDLFFSLTNDDEANIMSSLLAKRLGARKVVTLITKPAYVDLMEGGDIDIALSPHQVTVGSLLTHVRRGDMANVYSLRRGAAEAIEVVAHGDANSSKVVGRRLEEIVLPEGVTIGAIARGSEVLIAHRDVVVESEDHVVLFLIDKSRVYEVERLFQVGFSFI
ncbi:MAG: Trk system potassium transporter TrkA [Pseudomonadales bacterium]